VIEALRGASYKTPKGLRTELRWAEALDRDEFEGLLDTMLRAGLIEVEDAEFEKDGKVIPFRKFSLTDAGMEVRKNTPLALLFSDGIVEEFVGAPSAGKKTRATKRPAPVQKPLASAARSMPAEPNTSSVRRTAEPKRAPEAQVVLEGKSAELASRLREWRAAEAKKLGVPAFLVLHDRTLNSLAKARPGNPGELLGVEGMGPSKVGRFGEAILELCKPN
jgi:superfamily II DNA helicase RecQ